MATRKKTTTYSQSQLTLERRSSLEQLPQTGGIGERILEELINFKKEIRQELKDTRSEIKMDIKKEMEGINKKMEKMNKEIKIMQTEVKQMEERMSKVENEKAEIKEGLKRQDKELEIHELRYRDRCLKVRGLQERSGENIYDRLIPELASYIEIAEESMEQEIDKMFRISSKAAKEKNLPRDVLICFTRTRMKERILQRNYEEKFIVEGTELKIFKDIPFQTLKKRQEYKNLTTQLQKNNIRYKWERPEGLSFIWNFKRYKCNTPEQANEAIEEIREYKKGRVQIREQETPVEEGPDIEEQEEQEEELEREQQSLEIGDKLIEEED